MQKILVHFSKTNPAQTYVGTGLLLLLDRTMLGEKNMTVYSPTLAVATPPALLPTNHSPTLPPGHLHLPSDCPQRAPLTHPSPITVHRIWAIVSPFPRNGVPYDILFGVFPFSLMPDEADHYSPPAVASRGRLRPRPGEETSRSTSLHLDTSVELRRARATRRRI